jgi:calcineurin-like phosphoesterase family protein
MGYQPEEFRKLWPRLNGRKRLIVGNHDDIKFLSSGGFFDKVMMWRVFMDQKLLLTHVPVQEDSIHERIKDANGYNIHGHTHDKGSPISFAGPLYKSVCVELTNYTPVNIEELVND